MSLMKSLHGKQVVGIVLVVVMLIIVFVYGVRGYRSSDNYAAFQHKQKAPQTETCEGGSCNIVQVEELAEEIEDIR